MKWIKRHKFAALLFLLAGALYFIPAFAGGLALRTPIALLASLGLWALRRMGKISLAVTLGIGAIVSVLWWKGFQTSSSAANSPTSQSPGLPPS